MWVADAPIPIHNFCYISATWTSKLKACKINQQQTNNENNTNAPGVKSQTLRHKQGGAKYKEKSGDSSCEALGATNE
jgi:hypothetical protein